MLTATTTTHAVIRSAKGALGIHAEARGYVACLEREARRAPTLISDAAAEQVEIQVDSDVKV